MSTKGVPGKKRKYDWGTLFARKKFTLEYGKDFKIAAKAMIQQIKNTASSREVLVDIEVIQPSKTVPRLLIRVKVLP